MSDTISGIVTACHAGDFETFNRLYDRYFDYADDYDTIVKAAIVGNSTDIVRSFDSMYVVDVVNVFLPIAVRNKNADIVKHLNDLMRFAMSWEWQTWPDEFRAAYVELGVDIPEYLNRRPEEAIR